MNTNINTNKNTNADPTSTLGCHGVSLAGRLDNVSLSFTPGQVCAVVGPSGAGKSTLLSVLAGLIEPTSGRVDRPDGAAMGFAFQGTALWDHLTVRQHLDLVGRGKQDRSYHQQLLQRTNLLHLAERRPAQLSGGERQRLEIARAWAVRPAWLLLDEPTAHLDGTHREEVFELLRDTLSETDAAVVLATHHADEAMQLADRVVVMIDGRVVQDGSPGQVYRQPVSLEAARLLGPACVIEGQVRGSALVQDGVVLLEGLRDAATLAALGAVEASAVSGAAASADRRSLIVRPGDLRWVSDAHGEARVRRSLMDGARFVVEAEVGRFVVKVEHDTALAAGLTGRLVLREGYGMVCGTLTQGAADRQSAE